MCVCVCVCVGVGVCMCVSIINPFKILCVIFVVYKGL